MLIADILFAFAEWLRATWLADFSLRLSETPVSVALQSGFWAIPAIQTFHILSIGALFGSALMLSLRALGAAGNSRSMAQTARRFVPWIWWALLALLLSGGLLIVAEPMRELINPIFWIKMVLVMIAVAATLRFQASIGRRAANWDSAGPGRRRVRLGAVLLIGLWCAVMAGGRWIAYAPV